jgi:hypothetical protein
MGPVPPGWALVLVVEVEAADVGQGIDAALAGGARRLCL